MQRKIIYLINPISGTGQKKNIQALITKKTKEQHIPFFIYPTVASGDYSFLLDIVREEKITDVVICGGDGTVSQVVGALQKTGVNFGILPAGSGNGLAFAAHIPRSAARALDIVFAGQPMLTDAFTINGHFACMLCGLGFDARVAHDFARQPKRGLSTYIKQVVRNFFSAAPYSFEVRSGRKRLTAEAYFISIANSNQFGNNFTIAPKASLNDGLLDIVVMASPNKLSVLLQTLQQVGGFTSLQPEAEVGAKKGVIYFQAEKISIVNHSSAPLHIDGEPAETPEILQVEIKKNFFKLLQPAGKIS